MCQSESVIRAGSYLNYHRTDNLQKLFHTLDYISDENAGDQVITIDKDGNFHYEAYGSDSDYLITTEKETITIDGAKYDLYNVGEDLDDPSWQFLIPKDSGSAHGADAILNMGGILTFLEKQ
ncbi:MAG: hypothetical protein Q4D99_02035 [Bacillota bacterium]|nr:hypothetical protein [Bacillota bacterium]